MAEQVRLQEWAEQVRDCKNRPRGMNVETWCDQNNITNLPDIHPGQAEENQPHRYINTWFRLLAGF